MKITRVWINRVLGLLLAGGLAYLVYPFVVGGSKMQSFCEAIALGEPKEVVVARASAIGYSTSEPGNGRMLIIDSAAMGRYICDVSIADGRVSEAAYVFND